MELIKPRALLQNSSWLLYLRIITSFWIPPVYILYNGLIYVPKYYVSSHELQNASNIMSLALINSDINRQNPPTLA
jgi:hypothetical protein